MNTLVIHPDDRSTDFLKIIYENHKDWDVINDCTVNKYNLMEQIKAHDKIIMLGHGTHYGLLNPKEYGYLIDDDFASLLREKETISIWCNSDSYFKRNNIKGFHTGMIISEVSEAYYVLGFAPLSKEETLKNMINFSKITRDCIDQTPENMKNYILNHYNFGDEVTNFNRKNIIVL